MYYIEVDEKTEKGKEVIAYIKKLKPAKKEIQITSESDVFKLDDDELGLPGPVLNEAQMDYILSKPTGRAVSLKTARKKVLDNLKAFRKK